MLSVTPLSRIVINRHTFIDINSLIRWEINGEGGHGEDQDMWPVHRWSRMRRNCPDRKRREGLMSDYVQLAPDALLERIARTLKKEIGPAVEAVSPKTQAFMASVVLQKLAGQLRLADEHAAAGRRDLQELATELAGELDTASVDTPPSLRAAVHTVRQDLDTASVSRLIETLYATRSELGEERFESLIGRVRTRLRARIDREMVYAA